MMDDDIWNNPAEIATWTEDGTRFGAALTCKNVGGRFYESLDGELCPFGHDLQEFAIGHASERIVERSQNG